MGRVTPQELYHILWAANAYSYTADPSTEINNYLVVNRLWTPNIREDSGQPDAWRDYQQTLSELGLMYSRNVVPRIMPTALGMAFLDGSLGFSEIMTLQALRFQYPNGHQAAISSGQDQDLAGTPFATARDNVELQMVAGVSLRPAVLVWRVLRELKARHQVQGLNADDIERCLIPCATHADTNACIEAIVAERAGGPVLPRLGPLQRRHAQEWIRFLRFSPIFEAGEETDLFLRISDFGETHAAEIDRICDALERPETFWRPELPLTPAQRLQWYAEFGGIDLSLPELPEVEPVTLGPSPEFIAGREAQEDSEETYLPTEVGAINPRPFDPTLEPGQPSGPGGSVTIESVYTAELTTSQHRLHDQMLALIGRTCREKGADVYTDPSSVDLLVRFMGTEFIVEVKSVTPKNFIPRLRYALGQVLHYDYLRSIETTEPCRNVIALAARLPSTSWSIPFVTDYLGMDMISLDSGALRIHSRSPITRQLFS